MDATRVQALIAGLLRDAHTLAPLALRSTLETRVTALGFDEFELYVVDHDQRRLVPIPPANSGDKPLALDATLAGRAYQESVPVGDTADPASIWFPVRDGIDRLGALRLANRSWHDDLVAACESFAALVAGLLVSKGSYTDDFTRVRRRQPMTLGAEICSSRLPPLSLSTGDVSVAGALEPAYSVSGDAFDYALNGSSLHIGIFDGMGHDLLAARLADLIVSGYRYCRRALLPLSETYHYLDGLLRDSFGADRFCTAQLAVLDADRRTLELLNAGHPGPLLVRDGQISTLQDGERVLPLGLGDLGAKPVETRTVSLKPDDRLLMYTDGVTEARSGQGSLFGEQRLVDVMERARKETQLLAEAVRRVMHDVAAFRGGEWRDDATVVLVHWTPGGFERMGAPD
ncbi:MAG TPA: PP2C family protein-serine/threonine phosphatase [Acidimicrobiia bacterium]|nr:PP2C family protein-serine/threonine phosphatase [Acidimicrobiia bacterium]